MPRLRRRASSIAEEPGAHLRMLRLRSSDVDHGRHGDAPLQVAPDGVVLGRASHGNPLERHVGTPVRGPARHHIQDRLVTGAEAPTIDDGTYHGLRRKHVDTYLNEFVFRYNRRFYRHVSFETMLGLASRHHPTSYWDIVGRDNPRKGVPTVRRQPRRRRTATGMQRDGSSLSLNSRPSASSGSPPLKS